MTSKSRRIADLEDQVRDLSRIVARHADAYKRPVEYKWTIHQTGTGNGWWWACDAYQSVNGSPLYLHGKSGEGFFATVEECVNDLNKWLAKEWKRRNGAPKAELGYKGTVTM